MANSNGSSGSSLNTCNANDSQFFVPLSCHYRAIMRAMLGSSKIKAIAMQSPGGVPDPTPARLRNTCYCNCAHAQGQMKAVVDSLE